MTSFERARGQVLVLFALMLIAFLGFAALAIDVSGAFAELRHERAVADTAALAGASDTYRQGSSTVDNTEWTRARTHAMQNLVDELDPGYVVGDALPTCAGQNAPYSRNLTNCPILGTPYFVSISAPALTCVTIGGCDPVRSVQVTVRQPKHGLTFARIFGQAEWNLPVTSIAERNRGTNYSFVTLRPPDPRVKRDPSCYPACDANYDDILLDGGNTKLTVIGDMGTNTNMVLNGGASVVLSDPGSYVDRYDTYKAWLGLPLDRQISAPVPDPIYPIPTAPAAPALIYADAAAAHMTDADCTTEVGKVQASQPLYNVDAANIATRQVICLKPGRYTYQPSKSTSADGAFVDTFILSPGVYFLDKGMSPGQGVRVIGGYEPAQPGVALVFLSGATCSPACTFAGNGMGLLALNAGSSYPLNTGTPANPAVNWDGMVVRTTSTTPLPMSLIVQKNPACFVAITDPCNVNPSQWRQLTLPGGGTIFAFGVQYAPTDNVFITGGSGSNGLLGQMWAWTVKYTGGSNINLIGANNPEPGVLRIATPCSPGAACTDPAATVAIP